MALTTMRPALRPLANDENTQLFDSVAPDVKVKQSDSSALSSSAIAADAWARGLFAPVTVAVAAEALS